MTRTLLPADPDVRRVIHVGDIKDGGSRCDTSYFEARLADFQTFADPLVYTPGDNEWTDCHRATNGGYLPTERRATIRGLFFPRPGKTLGQDRESVRTQSRAFPENVSWAESGVQCGMVHVVGSNDDQAPWYGDRKDAAGAPLPETTAETALRAREYITRIVVQGSTSVPHEWLRLTVDPSSPAVFSCESVVFVSGAVSPCPAPLAPGV